MKHWVIWLITWAFVHNTTAQESVVRGRIQTTEMNPYTVLLKTCKDSSLVKAELMEEGGSFRLEHIPFDSYYVEIVLFNQLQHRTECLDIHSADHILPDIHLNTLTMKEVKIVGQKEVIEQKPGKIIFNVDATAESPGNDALSVLQKAPGVGIDQDDNISIRGKKGVLVMINGKSTLINGAQLANLLKTYTASQISKIEVISNPSAKYDAEGNAGIVNLILKKNTRKGTYGMAVVSGGTGKFYKSNGGINLNKGGKKWNLFSSLNLFSNENYNNLELYRQFYTNGVYKGAYRQHNLLWFPSNTEVGKLSLDYSWSKKTTLGISTTGSITQLNTPGSNYCVVENAQGADESTYTSQQKSKDRYGNFSVNLNSKTLLDSSGTELSTDWDYAYYGLNNDQHFKTVYADMDGQPTQSDYLLYGKTRSGLNILSAKADLTINRKRIKWEAGAKSSYVKADNNIGFYNESLGGSFFDSTQSNHFVYSENLNAMYGMGSLEKKKMSFQFGLRAEQTIAKGRQLLSGAGFDRNYWQLFPNVSMSKKFNEKHELAVSFSRRIQRPGYDLMNPTRLFIDATTFKVGNPYLMPQNSYLFELNHVLNQKYITSFSFMYINKSITEVLIPDEEHSNITIQTNKNLNKQWVYTLSGTIPWNPVKWFSMNNDMSAYHSFYSGQLSNNTISSGVISFNAKSMMMFYLPKAYTLQLDGFYQYGEWYSFTTIRPFGQINFSAQKTLSNKRTTIKCSANDLFFTSKFYGSSKYRDYEEHYFVRRDSRTFIVSITHKYGQSAGSPVRRRGTGADDEKQRANKNV